MLRFITPIILIGIAVAGFFMFTTPVYDNIAALRAQIASYNDALSNSKALENERDMLTAKYNTIDPNNLTRLQTLLPDNIDNIRLILEIGQIASPYGMVLQNVQYNATTPTTTTTTGTAPAAGGVVQGGAAATAAPGQDYGTWDLQFSVTGSYNNFLNFVKNLESNLRIVDISSISFTSGAGGGLSGNSAASAVYTYSFAIKTYWLKNN